MKNEILYQTKGDNNNANDAEFVKYEDVEGVYVNHIPQLEKVYIYIYIQKIPVIVSTLIIIYIIYKLCKLKKTDKLPYMK